jgi:hypothetical protein
MSDDRVDAKLDQLSGKLCGAIASPPGIAELERDVLAFRIAKIAQTPPKSIGKWMWRR